MKIFTQTLDWTDSQIPVDVVIERTEDHWESIEKHFANERMQVSSRIRKEAENDIRKLLEEEHQERARKVHALIKSFEEAIPSAFKEMEQALPHMACTLTKKMIAEVPIDTNRMQAVISQAMKELDTDSEIFISIHPADLELLRDESGEDPSLRFTNSGKLKFKLDTNLTRGGCYIRTPFGDFDATMETKWKRIESLFQKQAEDAELLNKDSQDINTP
jgi:flagellar biosynthesis/type III secretory pathway protein FliH